MMRLIFYTIKCFSLAFKYSKINLIFMLSIKVIQGFIPVVMLWSTSTAINKIVETLNSDRNVNEAIFYFCIQISCLLLVYILDAINSVNNQILGNKMGMSLKELLLVKINRISFLKFEDPKFYDSLSRIRGIEEKIIQNVDLSGNLIKNVITMITILNYLFNIHWLIILTLVMGIIPTMLLDFRFGKKRYLLEVDLSETNRKESYVSDHLFLNRDSLKEIKLYNLSNYLIEKWKLLYNKNTKLKLNLTIREKIYSLFSLILLFITYIVNGVIVIILINNGQALVGSFVAVMQALQNIQETLRTFSLDISKLNESIFFIKEYEEIVEIEEEHMQEEQFNNIKEINNLSISNLSFKYPSSNGYALKNVNFSIKKGEKIALVGINGSGKTTLIKCLTGLFKVEDDMIKVNNISLNKLDMEKYRLRLSVVFQDFEKFQFSIRENIGFGDIYRSNNFNEIKRSAKLAGIDKFINGLKNKYDSILGRWFDNGQDLSGGQWQKIALARTFFRKSDFLILDEPTSALDSKSEIELLNSLLHEDTNKTILFITHRLGLTRLADRILVMKEGEIIEQGTHEELLFLNREYATLYHSQADLYEQEKELINAN